MALQTIMEIVEKLNTVEVDADVTDATNVNTAGAVMETDYNAHTVMIATSTDTPVATTIAASRIVARLASGNIKACTVAKIKTLLSLPGSGLATFETILDTHGTDGPIRRRL